MRTAYHEQLEALSSRLGEMCGLAGAAMERATQALLQADLALAEQVITDHDQITASACEPRKRRSFSWPCRRPSRAICGPS